MSQGFKSRALFGQPSEPRTRLSRRLREISMLLGRGKREDALRLLENAASLADNDTERAKIANLVAKSQFELGRYEDAANRFAEAARLGAAEGLDPPEFLGPSLGRIRCLLKAQALTEALSAAEDLAKRVEDKADAYDKKLSGRSSSSEPIRVLTVPARPVRPPVALTRIGVTFLEEGYLEAGKSFLERVIVLVPYGASRARQFLAKTLLLEAENERAERLAAESLNLGAFRAKTIPSWEILIRARKAQGKPLLDSELYQNFRHTRVNGRVAARAELLIISELRRHGDPLWLDLARGWRNSPDADPIVRVEMLKMVLSEIKAGTLHAEDRANAALRVAKEIYDEPTLAASESIGLAKVLGEFGPTVGLPDRQIKAWLRRTARRYGDQYGLRAAHSCALGMAEKQNFASARPIFRSLIDSAPIDSPDWGKAVWSLAKVESADGNPAAAVELYLKFAANSALEPSLRLQAFLRWIRKAEESGVEIDLLRARTRVAGLLADMDNYRPLLDAGRQLALAGPRFNEVFSQVADAAEERSLAAFEQSKTTQEALVVLLTYARRNFYDFGRKNRLLGLHESFTDERLNWLWSHDARFWEYLSIIMRAYFVSGRHSEGEAIGRSATDDPTTPMVGRVYLGVHYAEWLFQRGQPGTATALLRRVIAESPSHRLSSRAHYWLALRAYKSGDKIETKRLLLNARKCLLPRPGFHSEWEIDARSGLLLRQISSNPGTIDLSLFSEDFLARQNAGLKRDLAAMALKTG